jgi:ZIP family zinc transporter
MLTAILWGGLAAASLLVGYFLAERQLSQRSVGMVMGIGAGALMWASLVAISAVCAGLGYLIIRWLPGADGRFAQAFAAGAMLTMLADAMMPEAFKHGGKLVGLCTVLGFLMAVMLAVMG